MGPANTSRDDGVFDERRANPRPRTSAQASPPQQTQPLTPPTHEPIENRRIAPKTARILLLAPSRGRA
jgi:hypothetical protein